MKDAHILARLEVENNASHPQFFGRDAIVVFARAPIRGAVKTRLAKEIGAEPATRIYAAMLRDCLEWAQRGVGGEAGVLVCHTPSDAFEPGAHSLSQFWSGAHHPQCEGDLSTRLLDCFSHLRKCGAQKIIVIGSDAPDIPATYFHAAFRALDSHDLVFGPAHDGGFYLIGAREISPNLFAGATWSSASTLAAIRDNALRRQQSTLLLDEWRDVDDIEDLKALIARLQAGVSDAPHTRRVLRSEELLEN